MNMTVMRMANSIKVERSFSFDVFVGGVARRLFLGCFTSEVVDGCLPR